MIPVLQTIAKWEAAGAVHALPGVEDCPGCGVGIEHLEETGPGAWFHPGTAVYGVLTALLFECTACGKHYIVYRELFHAG